MQKYVYVYDYILSMFPILYGAFKIREGEIMGLSH